MIRHCVVRRSPGDELTISPMATNLFTMNKWDEKEEEKNKQPCKNMKGRQDQKKKGRRNEHERKMRQTQERLEE